MSSIIFTDKRKAPSEAELQDAIGEPFGLWPAIFQTMEENYGSIVFEWKFYGKKNGWLGKNLINDRNMFFFIPVEQGFKLAFTFGAKAISEIENSTFPEAILNDLREAKQYAEGKSIQVSIDNKADCELAAQLIQIKYKN